MDYFNSLSLGTPGCQESILVQGLRQDSSREEMKI